ncbi:ferritin-like domain-containing protein [Xylaria sp. CBS 124048]|nr:ferritin-like domain-containing protein [Xylaria sp. CBS 124048]
MVGFNSKAYAGLLGLALRCHAMPANQEANQEANPESPPMTTMTSMPSGPIAAPVVPVTNVTSHGPYTGPSPTTTGALTTSVLAPSIPARPPEPYKLQYPADGQLHSPLPAPYVPAGGLGTNGTEPVYRVQSDFDYESIALALYQEYIELDLFHWGLATYSVEDFEANGLTAEDRHLIQFMADQEVGHATLLTNMLGPSAPRQCTYNYPTMNVREYIDFCQKLTRWGESGVYGFLNHLDAREVGQMLLQSISVEARQQLIFRQFEGLFPMPVWFEVGVPQSWAWTLLAPYISSCPENQTRLVWQNYPALHILNQPNPARINGSSAWNETLGDYANTLSTQSLSRSDSCVNATGVGINCSPAITRNRTDPLSYPGRHVYLQWDNPGQHLGPNNSYVTATTAGPPRFAAWVTQLNVTYSPLQNISGNTAFTVQPDVSTFEGDPAANGTIFLVLTDRALPVTPFNITQLNPFVNALTLYQAG